VQYCNYTPRGELLNTDFQCTAKTAGRVEPSSVVHCHNQWWLCYIGLEKLMPPPIHDNNDNQSTIFDPLRLCAGYHDTIKALLQHSTRLVPPPTLLPVATTRDPDALAAVHAEHGLQTTQDTRPSGLASKPPADATEATKVPMDTTAARDAHQNAVMPAIEVPSSGPIPATTTGGKPKTQRNRRQPGSSAKPALQLHSFKRP
jgi:hypothetical protein